MRKLRVSVLMLVSTLAVATPADAATPTLTGTYLWSATVPDSAYHDVVLLTLLQTGARTVDGTTVNLEGSWQETTTGASSVSDGLNGPATSSRQNSFRVLGYGNPSSFWITIDDPSKLTLQAAMRNHSIIATYPPAGGGLRSLTFQPSNGTVGYEADVNLFSLVDNLNLASSPPCVPRETLPIAIGNERVAVASYMTRSPLSMTGGHIRPVVGVFVYRTLAWRQVALLPGSGWCPSGITSLARTVIPGATAVLVTFGTLAADINWPGVIVSNVGHRWHLVDFAVPARFASGKPVLTHTLLSPAPGKRIVRLWEYWAVGDSAVGACSQSVPYRFAPSKGEFRVAGPVEDHFSTSHCQKL